MDHSIVTFDEASFRLVPVYRRTWFIKGEKPKGIFFWSNQKIIIFGALINGKKLYYEFFNSMNTLTFKMFLLRFVEQLPKGKYVFLFDNAPYHKSSTIKKYLESLSGRFNIILTHQKVQLNSTSYGAKYEIRHPRL